ncbi:MAG TPA: hypothetical protein DD611_02620 [Alphaproteobacteria bacterium]|nr:hypothetical protein [Alphaproteobacteria bacterium]
MHRAGQRLPRRQVWENQSRKNNMSEKFRKIVRSPEEAAKKLRKKIGATRPAEYVRARADGDKLNAGAVAGIAALGTAKWSAWLAAGGTQFMLWLARVAALDNAILRHMEKTGAVKDVKLNKDGTENKLSKFRKKNPNFVAHLKWYFALSILAGAGAATMKYGPDIVQTVQEQRAEREAAEARRGTYAAYLDKMQSITPFLIADLIAKEGIHVDSNGMHIPYQDSRGVWTIGFGSTMLKDKTPVTSKTKPITNDEAYELARWHLEAGETYFIMYCYDTAVPDVDISTTERALGTGSIVYNSYSKLIENPKARNTRERFAALRADFDEFGYATPDSLILKRFAQYPVLEKDETSFGRQWLHGGTTDVLGDKLGGFLAGGRGVQWRRWLEAGLFTGEITPNMLLDCPVNGMYEFYKCMDADKEAFFIGVDSENRRVNHDTYAKFYKWLENPVTKSGLSLARWKKISDYLPPDIVELCRGGKCELGNREIARHVPTLDTEIGNTDNIAVKTYVLEYDELYADAISSYKAGDFVTAAAKYRNMLSLYPNNALLHNDLAATYNKLGMYDDAIAQVREIVHRIGDKGQYAAAYYNAGFAYEQQGNLQKALANYKLALANGNRRVQRDITRVRENMNKAVSRGKRMAFGGARAKLQNKSRGDLLVYGIEHKGNMA